MMKSFAAVLMSCAMATPMGDPDTHAAQVEALAMQINAIEDYQDLQWAAAKGFQLTAVEYSPEEKAASVLTETDVANWYHMTQRFINAVSTVMSGSTDPTLWDGLVRRYREELTSAYDEGSQELILQQAATVYEAFAPLLGVLNPISNESSDEERNRLMKLREDNRQEWVNQRLRPKFGGAED